MKKPMISLLHLKQMPIYEQLQLEEALLRLDTRNLCLINEGSSPAIVMGISGKIDHLVDSVQLQKYPIPVIKRFSGGGTVLVDQNTLFVSFLCQKQDHSFLPYPEAIMKWTESIYKQALKLKGFQLRENDYVIGERKFGGNAQYLRKDRWLHHSTLLWDYDPERMKLLLHPAKTPKYRLGRSHEDFLTKLSAHLPSKEKFISSLKQSLADVYEIEELSYGDVSPFLEEPHRQSTEYVFSPKEQATK